MLRKLSCFILFDVAGNVCAEKNLVQYEHWNLETVESVSIYQNYTPKKVNYAIGVDATLSKSGKVPDPVSVNCAGSKVKVYPGRAIACHLPPYSMVRWSIAENDFHNGSQGRQGKLDS